MNLKKVLSCILIFVSLFTIVGCEEDRYKNLENGINDEYTLYLQTSSLDGSFNPFFYSSALDRDVFDLISTSLFTLGPNGNIVAGDEYPTVALDYSIWYTNDPVNYAPKDTYNQGDYVVYEIVLKNGMKYSDGTSITVEDVLFNYYFYLDTAYDGLSTINTLPILGLDQYRNQTSDPKAYDLIIEAILNDDTRNFEYVENEVYNKQQHDTYWTVLYQAGATFADEIVDFVNELLPGYEELLHPDLTTEDVQSSEQLRIAYAMLLWQYGLPLSEDQLTIEGGSGTIYNVADLTSDLFFREILKVNEDENGKLAIDGGYQGLSELESVGSDFVADAAEKFVEVMSEKEAVTNISGLIAGKKYIDGVQHDTVKVVLTKQDANALHLLNIIVSPKKHYTNNFIYHQDDIVNYGVVYGSNKFNEHIKNNTLPMGAGPYKFVRRDPIDGTVYFERNEYFHTMGGENIFNTYIKNVALRKVTSGSELDSLKNGYVHFATVNPTIGVTDVLANQAKINEIWADNSGYEYIYINPEVYPNLYERIALNTIFDLERIYDFYSDDVAEIIYRSQSKGSWAYPEGSEAVYSYDETLAKAIEYFTLAGFDFDDESRRFVDFPKEYEFFVPSEASKHPVGLVFLKAVDLLSTIGIPAKVNVDTNLAENVNAGGRGIYTLTRQTTSEPDLYHDYHYESQVGKLQHNGIFNLYEIGNDNNLGVINGINQREALIFLAELIEEGKLSMNVGKRKQIYEQALNLLAQFAIEIPVYQTKNLFAYNGAIVQIQSLSRNVTPYRGPLSEIWKVRFVKGTPGNQKAGY